MEYIKTVDGNEIDISNKEIKLYLIMATVNAEGRQVSNEQRNIAIINDIAYKITTNTKDKLISERSKIKLEVVNVRAFKLLDKYIYQEEHKQTYNEIEHDGEKLLLVSIQEFKWCIEDDHYKLTEIHTGNKYNLPIKGSAIEFASLENSSNSM